MKFFAFIFYILFFPLYSIWLILCASIALLGTFLKNKNEALDIEVVKDEATVCKILHEKNILSAEEYNFETNQVASIYDAATFVGYLFIMSPIIFIIKRVNWLDGFILHLVHRWIKVHQYKLSISNHVSSFDRRIVKTCVSASHNTGAVLLFLKLENKVKEASDG